MRQRDLFESPQPSTIFLVETIEMELIDLLGQLMLSTFNATAATDEESSDEPDQR